MRAVRFVLVALTALAVVACSLLPAPAEAKTTAKVLKVLVVPVHFGTKLDTVATARKLVQTDTGGWLSTVSRKRVTLKSTVTPVMRVKTSCVSVTDNAKTAASKKGYRLSRYDLIIVLAPTCPKHSSYEHALLSQQRDPDELTLYGRQGRTVGTIARQFGYLLGQDTPAHSLECQVKGRLVTVAASRSCLEWFLTDDIDPMGSGTLTGSYSAPVLDEFRWLTASQRVTRTGGTATIRLAPLLGGGVRVIKARAKGVTYWVEYRTRTGVDSQLRPELAGVRIWRSTDASSQLYKQRNRHVLLDMVPGNRWFEPLRPGSTWTSPEGVSVRVNGATDQAASVTVRFGAPKPKTPLAPRITAVSGDEEALVSWTAAPDRGRPVTLYDLEARDPRGHLVWQAGERPGGPRQARISGTNGVPLTIRVRATNDLGVSSWATAKVTPTVRAPSVRILSPAPGAVIEGRAVQVVVEASAHPRANRPVTRVNVGIGWADVAATRRPDGTYAAVVDVVATGRDGALQVTAEASDATGDRRAVAYAPITVPRRLPTPTLTGPDADPIRWDGPTLTVTFDPGADRFTGEPPESIWVSAAGSRRTRVTADDHWTVVFPRSALPPEAVPDPTLVATAFRDYLSSEDLVRPIALG